MIEGKLISLVELNETHLPQMVEWRNDPFVSRFMIDQSNFTLAKQIEWFDKIKADKSRQQFIIVRNKSGESIGVVNLMRIVKENNNCYWGFYIGDQNFRMGGYAIEAEFLILQYAFHVLEMNKVYCETLSYNSKVISVHKKFGFNIEGELKKQYKIHDRYENVVVMSILKNEFSEASTSIETLLNRYSR